MSLESDNSEDDPVQVLEKEQAKSGYVFLCSPYPPSLSSFTCTFCFPRHLLVARASKAGSRSLLDIIYSVPLVALPYLKRLYREIIKDAVLSTNLAESPLQP